MSAPRHDAPTELTANRGPAVPISFLGSLLMALLLGGAALYVGEKLSHPPLTAGSTVTAP